MRLSDKSKKQRVLERRASVRKKAKLEQAERANKDKEFAEENPVPRLTKAPRRKEQNNG